MIIVPLGGVGIGLVWGWLLVLVGDSQGPRERPFRNAFALTLATFLLGLCLFLLSNGQNLFLFALATPFSLMLHFAWRRSLRGNQAPSSG